MVFACVAKRLQWSFITVMIKARKQTTFVKLMKTSLLGSVKISKQVYLRGSKPGHLQVGMRGCTLTPHCHELSHHPSDAGRSEEPQPQLNPINNGLILLTQRSKRMSKGDK